MGDWARIIFSYNRSITGDGVRKTLKFFKKINPEIKILSFTSGYKCFDWTVPNEWEIKDRVYYLKGKNKTISRSIRKKRQKNKC